MLAIFSHFLTSNVSRYGLPAIFLLMVLDSACIPIPSEVVLGFGGALASGTFAAHVLGDAGAALSLPGVILAGVAGNLVGSSLAYAAGATGGRPLIDRWGRYLLLRPHEVDRADIWFERHGQAAVFFGRMIPLVRAFISLPAGMARMPFGRFSSFTLLGVVPWVTTLTLAGYLLGHRWATVERLLAPISIVVAVIVVAAIAWWARRRLRDRAATPISR